MGFVFISKRQSDGRVQDLYMLERRAPPAVGTNTVSVGIDSQFRYLSGLLLAIGLGFWSTIPGIEAKTARFRLLVAAVVIGGITRASGVIVLGQASPSTLLPLAMELAVTPLLFLWQMRVAAKAVVRCQV